MKAELVDLSDQVWQRLRARVEGLTDEEYLWEPAPGCWTIRPRADGRWAEDSVLPGPDPEPFTTLAWRLWHIIDCYGEDRAPGWLGVPPQGPAIGLDGGDSAPPTAAAAVEMLERAHDRWEAHLALVDDAILAQPVGPVGGTYAARPKASYVLHMLDEYIHHGAEVALLRDLWRWQHTLVSDSAVEQVMRGDTQVLDGLGAATPSPDLVDHAASYARWDILADLLQRGAPLPTTGVSPLHRAAGAGEVAVVELLLERGADPSALDPQFHATPQQWAAFLHRHDVVAVLEEHAARHRD